MTDSVVLDTAIGLVFVFLTASLICTGILEGIANRLNKRGDYLLRGLREMLDIPPVTPGAPGLSSDVGAGIETEGLAGKNKDRRAELQKLATHGAALGSVLAASAGATGDPSDPEANKVQLKAPLADLVLAHPLIAVLHRPARPGSPGGSMHLTSYLSERTFAASLIDLLVPNGAGKTTIDELTRMVEQLDPNIPARAALLALLRDAGESIETFRRSLEGWYNEQMGRVSGWYKRWAQGRLLIAGLLLAVLVNVDTVGISQALYHDKPVRDAVVAQAVSAQGCSNTAGPDRDACLANQQQVLNDLPLPLGWDLTAAGSDCMNYNGDKACGANPVRLFAFAWHSITDQGVGGVILKLLGWVLTGLAVALGAPFWFDSLSKLGSLRTAGRRPGENAPFSTIPASTQSRAPLDPEQQASA